MSGIEHGTGKESGCWGKGLWSENFDELAPVVAHWTGREISAALEAAHLMTTRSHDAVNGVVVANDALYQLQERWDHYETTGYKWHYAEQGAHY